MMTCGIELCGFLVWHCIITALYCITALTAGVYVCVFVCVYNHKSLLQIIYHHANRISIDFQ
jgi:hypothetical protein